MLEDEGKALDFYFFRFAATWTDAWTVMGFRRKLTAFEPLSVLCCDSVCRCVNCKKLEFPLLCVNEKQSKALRQINKVEEVTQGQMDSYRLTPDI